MPSLKFRINWKVFKQGNNCIPNLYFSVPIPFKEVTYHIQTTITIITTHLPPPRSNVSKTSGWRDGGFVILDAVFVILGVRFVGGWKKIGHITLFARRVLARVLKIFYIHEKSIASLLTHFSNLLRIHDKNRFCIPVLRMLSSSMCIRI
jgi:hypothetical protein